jgi:hypothetical protein
MTKWQLLVFKVLIVISLLGLMNDLFHVYMWWMGGAHGF